MIYEGKRKIAMIKMVTLPRSLVIGSGSTKAYRDTRGVGHSY